ncbi:MAG: 50S ribosomal protein L18 [Gallionellaceae bacterium CG1_02_60_948]|nr:MAG: 50S ribosomal protein L18 [Gallionellaceae bacterium CG1_02_60_948]PIU17562.1 MAG: 50S ribosomal protein L18 [Gallionellales bacterium CG08_land_8_20_14_0_20_59_87]PJC02961.1 MAG: 50S ribosomal protein L18 [Gallionellales bacterium CG_4_9_14_0_8_um_filter_59_50]
MLNTNEARQRRARKTRARIAKQKAIRLSIHRTNLHIYAQVISADGGTVLASASTLEAEVRKSIANGGNATAAAVVGKRIAEKAKSAGVTSVAFDRSGNQYHGRIKALADAARENGLQF